MSRKRWQRAANAQDPADDVALWLEHDVWPEQRAIYLGNRGGKDENEDYHEVTPQMVESAIKSLLLLSHQDATKPIVIYMNSLGGSYYDGLGVYDAIRETKAPVVMKCYGWCMSSATAILQAADVRVLSPNCRFLIHDGTDGFNGNPRDLERWAAQAKKDRMDLYKIYAERSGRTIKFWEKMCLRDTFMTAEEAVAYGLADRISHPVKQWPEVSTEDEES